MTDLSAYYDTFDPSKRYKRMLFRAGQGLQSREMNEIARTLMHEVSRLASVVHTEGSIISGGATNLTNGILSIAPSTVFARGFTHDVPAASIPISLIENTNVGILIQESVITELEDPGLRDPAVNTRNFNQPGSHRLRMTATWVKQNQATTGVGNYFFPIHVIENGVLVSRVIEAPEIAGIDARLASYDRSANGSYVVDGFEVTFVANDNPNNRHVLSVSEGTAHVDGYINTFDFARRVAVDFAIDTRSVNNEPILFTGNGWYNLRWNPIASLQEVNGSVIVTRNITHGNFIGASDLLPDRPVISVIAVNQGGTWNGTNFVGGTNYNVGTDYILNGDFIDWSPAGGEPATGSTYTVVYVYQAVLNVSISADRRQIRLENLQPNSTVLVDYTFYIPRYDRIVLARDGSLNVLKGVPNFLNPTPPSSTSGLQLATIYVEFGKLPQITSDYFRAFKMSDIQAMITRLDRVDYNMAQLALRDDIRSKDPTTNKKNLFVDPFINDTLRDAGYRQNAIIVSGTLFPGVRSTDVTVRAGNPITLNSTEVTAITQNGYSKTRKLNEFEKQIPPPGVASVTPNNYAWTADTVVDTQTTFQTQTNWVNEWVWWIDPTRNNSVINTTTTISGQRTTDVTTNAANALQFSIPQITVQFSANRFNVGEQVRVVFDGLVLGTTFTAGAGGVVTGSFQVPPNLPAGTKQILFEGVVSGVQAQTTFTATPQIRRVTNFSTVTTTLTRVSQLVLPPPEPDPPPPAPPVIWWGWDPLAQTFTPNEDFSISSVEVQFDNATTQYVDMYIVETVNGYPNATKTMAHRRMFGNELSVGGWTKFTFPFPVPVKANEQYAVVMMTPDTDLRARVAELGAWDIANQVWFTRQQYLTGVLFNSSNATAWTALQTEDLMFRINRANFTPNQTKTDLLGTVSVTAATDLMLMAQVSVVPNTFAEFEATLVNRGNEVIGLSPNVPVAIAEYTGQIQIRSRIRTTNSRHTPIIDGVVQLAVGQVQFPSSYVNRMFTFSGTKLTVILDVREPSNTAINVGYFGPQKTLTPAGQNHWAPVTTITGGSAAFGTYRYTGPDLTGGIRPARIEIGGLEATLVDSLAELGTGLRYVFGNFNNLAADTVYIRQPVIVVSDEGVQWFQSAVTTEWYYGQTDITAIPSQVMVGNTLLTPGTQGALAAGQFAYGAIPGQTGNRLVIRMPNNEVIAGNFNPVANVYPADFVKICYDPDTLGNTYVRVNEWIKLTRESSRQVDNGYVEVVFGSTGTLGITQTQLLVELTSTDKAQRPSARNLRSYVV